MHSTSKNVGHGKLLVSIDILSLKSQSVLLKGARRESSFQISRAQLIKLREDKRS